MKQILTFFTFLIFSTLAFAQENIPYTSYIIIESFSNIEFKDASEGVHVSKSPIKKDGKNKTLVRVLVQNKGNDWKDVSLKIRLPKDDYFTIAFTGYWHSKNGQKIKNSPSLLVALMHKQACFYA